VDKVKDMELVGRKGNLILKRADGRVELYRGEIIGVNETHLRLRMYDGRETDLLKSDIQKIEWSNGGKG
jgi:hypothetical protein